MQLKLYAGPTSEPVTLDEAKLHLRVDIDDDDTLIHHCIAAARQMVEDFTWRSLFTQTWDMVLDAWPDTNAIELPLPPLQSVTGVYYTDEDGTEATFASTNYVVNTYSTPGRLVLKSSSTWPSTTLQETAGVRVRFISGWSSVGAIPVRFKQATLLLVGAYYENREALVEGRSLTTYPYGVENLLWADRVMVF